MLIVLIGYRGTGKSSVATKLSEKLGIKHLDADAEIERRAGKTIRQLFVDEGEPRFRQIEQEVMADFLKESSAIIDAGGGAVMNPETRKRLCTRDDSNRVVWLQASAESIETRLTVDTKTTDRRPNLTDRGGRAEIEQLLVEREPVYRECASIIIETDKLNIDQIVKSILATLEHPPEGKD